MAHDADGGQVLNSGREVVVVGGGLAGLSAAITLAQAGARVSLFEAKAYPHHKVCGEFLSPECSHVLHQLGAADALRAARPVPIQAAVITAPNGTHWQAHFGEGAIGISRYALDEMLFQHALACGVQVHAETTVTGIDGDLAGGYILHTRTRNEQGEHRADIVLCAHGKRSALDRALKRPFLNTPQAFIGLKAHFYGPPLHQRVELHTFNGGYCGIAPIEGGKANVCLLARSDVFQAAGATILAFIEWIQTQNAGLRRWLSQATLANDGWHSIHQVPFLSKELSSRGMLMLGDAARLIAPLAGDGMGMALQSGQLAALHTSQYLDGRISAERFIANYTRDWHKQFGARLRLARGLQTCLFNPRALALGLHVLNGVPSLGNYLVANTRDRQYA